MIAQRWGDSSPAPVGGIEMQPSQMSHFKAEYARLYVIFTSSQAFTSFYPDDLIHLFGFLHCRYTRILLLTCLVFFCTEL